MQLYTCFINFEEMLKVEQREELDIIVGAVLLTGFLLARQLKRGK